MYGTYQPPSQDSYPPSQGFHSWRPQIAGLKNLIIPPEGAQTIILPNLNTLKASSKPTEKRYWRGALCYYAIGYV